MRKPKQSSEYKESVRFLEPPKDYKQSKTVAVDKKKASAYYSTLKGK